ncbi:hypothetical protein H9P43_008002 [Blastocladiella emersonii ATCC 22665]|nr:hypothetical protein H9P43_008002 [Blastocladiella emersonii ATCC 22665]
MERGFEAPMMVDSAPSRLSSTARPQDQASGANQPAPLLFGTGGIRSSAAPSGGRPSAFDFSFRPSTQPASAQPRSVRPEPLAAPDSPPLPPLAQAAAPDASARPSRSRIIARDDGSGNSSDEPTLEISLSTAASVFRRMTQALAGTRISNGPASPRRARPSPADSRARTRPSTSTSTAVVHHSKRRRRSEVFTSDDEDGGVIEELHSPMYSAPAPSSYPHAAAMYHPYPVPVYAPPPPAAYYPHHSHPHPHPHHPGLLASADPTDQPPAPRSSWWALDAPALLMGYLQLAWNAAAVIALGVVCWQVYSSVQADVTLRKHEALSRLGIDIDACRRHYEANRCAPATRAPALNEVCAGWESCMARDPDRVPSMHAGAEMVAEVLDAFVAKLSVKTMAFCAGALAVYLLVNWICSCARRTGRRDVANVARVPPPPPAVAAGPPVVAPAGVPGMYGQHHHHLTPGSPVAHHHPQMAYGFGGGAGMPQLRSVGAPVGPLVHRRRNNGY